MVSIIEPTHKQCNVKRRAVEDKNLIFIFHEGGGGVCLGMVSEGVGGCSVMI